MAAEPTGLWYLPSSGYDELVEPDGRPRPATEALWRHLTRLGPAGIEERQRAADREIRAAGVTFGASADADEADRPWPFDVIPRVVTASEWQPVEAGLVQRLTALNRFIDDVYHDQMAVRDGVVPADLVAGSPNFRAECVGVEPPGGIWAHICGTDLVRAEDGTLYVLEDNLRVPSGASYLLENRRVSKHAFPELFRSYSVEPVDHYLAQLGALLASLVPEVPDPRIVVLTPGVYNSAYFEHAFLAQQLGVDLVEGMDLVVADDRLHARTIGGLEPVDVVYRRIDDSFLDPEAFRHDSQVGVAGLVRAFRAGNVALVNAPGTGVADDKGLYPYVGDLVRYYLGEEPLLPSVPTWRCADPEDCRFVLDNLDALVVKPTNESGGYGIVIGPQAGADALKYVARRIEAHPAGWVAQPLLSLSTMPTMVDGAVVPRHVDLRPFTLLGPNGGHTTPGGLTRVARPAGSLIVNSSQGGGSKDTWVVDERVPDLALRPLAEGQVDALADSAPGSRRETPSEPSDSGRARQHMDQ